MASVAAEIERCETTLDTLARDVMGCAERDAMTAVVVCGANGIWVGVGLVAE